jgi:hypothetical protein
MRDEGARAANLRFWWKNGATMRQNVFGCAMTIILFLVILVAG